MNPEIKKKWVSALRSGDYEQVNNFLKTTKGYCCLGVLRAVMDPEDTNSANNNNTTLTTNQREKCGLSDRDQDILAALNDGTRGLSKHSFGQIAIFIDTYL